MSMTFVRMADQQRVRDVLKAYYASADRPGPAEVVAEAERHLKVWEDGFEPAPAAHLKLLISPPSDSWIAIAFPGGVTFDLPFTAWLASQLQTEAVAAYTWGDGYGLVAFGGNGITYSQGPFTLFVITCVARRMARRLENRPFNSLTEVNRISFFDD